MLTKALLAAGAGITAILGVWAVQEVSEEDAPQGASTAMADRGPYETDYAATPRNRPDQTGGGADAVSGSDEAAASDSSTPRELRRAHGALADAAPPGEDSWLPVSVDGEDSPHPVWHVTVLPGDTIELSADDSFALSLDGEIVTDEAGAHSWTAPREPGVHTLRAFTADGDQQYLSAFVLTPYDGETVLEGYRIGSYPETAPEGFIRLTEADMDTPVSPSFEIGQFICKQQIGHWPKFIVTSGPMLKRLELLLENLREDGRTDADTFFIMSGFRTPFYNTAIGSARLSRHMYGDASDIYPDVDGNGVMDDINNDGRVTRADAEWLYDYAAELFAASDEVEPGGIGDYGATAVHGPFVHIDGRGRAARWGRYGS